MVGEPDSNGHSQDLSERRVVIIGAGPGGLAAAIALGRAGVPVAVFERSPQMVAVGAGIGVQSNAMRALMRIGVGQTLLEKGVPVEWSEFRSSSDKLLLRLPIGEISQEFGAPTVNVLRSDLQAALLDALPDGVLHLGAECVGAYQDEIGPVARFADGHKERGAVLIGADGGRSVVRRAILGGDEPRYTDFTSWRAVVPWPDALDAGTAYAYFGRGLMIVALPAAPGKGYWGVLSVAPPGGQDPPGTVKQTLAGLVESFPAHVVKMIDSTPEEAINRADIYDRTPVSNWVDGRIALLGDAAHMPAPFTGQGAGLAMEDGIVLAKELSLTAGLEDESMITTALEAYQAKRIERANSIVTAARRRGKVSSMTSPLGCAVRDISLRVTPSRFQRRSIAASIGYEI